MPTSTYRLQVRASFDLEAVAEVAPYLHDLGVDWLYLSPLLQAEPGSGHGYDVVDPTRVDAERGGSAGLSTVVTAARANSLGILVDIVPNHVGVASPPLNAWWRDLLTYGRDSRYAEAFDVDWAAGEGKVRIPVLGDGDDIRRSVRVEGGELRYAEHRYPIAPGTGGGDPVEVHARQHYELMNWRRADTDANYRRFFAVNTLAGIRVEAPWVFDEAHEEIGRWFEGRSLDGIAVDGLRVDHPDGLYDPAGYLDRLSELTGGAYTVVEKILESGEHLPPWRIAGTTGYDSLGAFDRVLIDPGGEERLTALDTSLRGHHAAWPDMAHRAKREIADGILHSEVLRLVRELRQDAAGFDDATLADAVAELAACFPVYRSYLPAGGMEPLWAARAEAERRRPDLAEALSAVSTVLADPRHPAARRFQQTSGMVMAKGVEDTAFYRCSRLTSLTEVGGDPSHFSIPVSQFHAAQLRRQHEWPETMTTLSTHDTKRSEDARARLDVLAEVADDWAGFLARVRPRAPLGDGPLENLLWQAIVAVWPATRERLHAYAEKAAREAGVSTSWSHPNADFEQRMHRLVDAAFDDERVGAALEEFLAVVAPAGHSNSLAAKLLQLTAPGVPDVYQGTELWDFSLVDPDNRRPVDFGLRKRMLGEILEGDVPPVDETGAAKLLLVHRALTLRRDRPDLFAGYRPVIATGPAAGHAVAFDRGSADRPGAVAVATRLPVGLAAAGGWQDTTVRPGSERYRDILTGRVHAGPRLRLADLTSTFPVALLLPEGEA